MLELLGVGNDQILGMEPKETDFSRGDWWMISKFRGRNFFKGGIM
jgi:hypothetical protein